MVLTRLAVGLEALNPLDAAGAVRPESLARQIGFPAGPALTGLIKQTKNNAAFSGEAAGC